MEEHDNKPKDAEQNNEYIDLSFEIPLKKLFMILTGIICFSFITINLYFFLLDNLYNSPHNYIDRISSSDNEVKLANITGSEIENIVILKAPVKTILDESYPHQQSLLIYSYNKKEHVWKQEYETKFFSEYSVKMNIEPNLIDGKDAIIISRHEGSGGYLTYYIIGKYLNYTRVLQSNEYSEAIHNGSYKIINNKFITYSSDIKQDEFCYNNVYGVFRKCAE